MAAWRAGDIARVFFGSVLDAAKRDAPARFATPGDCFEAVTVGVPVERAWSLLIDLSRWPQWASAIGAVVAIDGDSPRIGARFAMRFAGGLRATWRVVAVESGRHLALEAQRPGLRARIELDLAAAGTATTRVISRLDFVGPLAETAWRTAALRIGADLVSIATEFRLHAELQHDLDALP